METSFHSLLDSNTVIATKFCTWHDRCVNSITETVKMKYVTSCVIYGDSVYDCHTVNYNARDQICEVIASNGVVMHVQNRDYFILATFGNNYDFIKTGIEADCAPSVVQWREQFTQAYVEYDNLANSDENTRDGYVCKVSVGDNEFPGTSTASVASRRCTFIHNGYAGFAEIYRVLVLEASSNLEPVWKSYNVGDLFPSEAFVGGRKADYSISAEHCGAGYILLVTMTRVMQWRL